jgi:ubiquinone/menaquinone biosynthesis C-methylase UbiE
MKEHIRFFDRQASSWDEQTGERNSKIEEVVFWFQIRPGNSVLDVGTGTGVLLPVLSREIGSGGLLTAMDFSSRMLDKARERSCPGMRYLLNGAVMAIPLRSERFDHVTCFSAFPHFPDKKKALQEMVRVLKRGASLHIAHLQSAEELNRLHREIGDVVAGDGLPSPEEMQVLLTESGLLEVNVVNEPGRFLAQGRRR